MEKVNRGWGYYTVLQDSQHCKIKELVVLPNSCLSYQRHRFRNELWFVKSGRGKVIINNSVSDLILNSSVLIKQLEWHQLINGTNENLIIIEIQYGAECVEEDIERQ